MKAKVTINKQSYYLNSVSFTDILDFLGKDEINEWLVKDGNNHAIVKICSDEFHINGWLMNCWWKSRVELDEFIRIARGFVPKAGKYVFDIHENRRRKLQSVKEGGKLFLIGSEREPVYRNEFIFPLPKYVTA